MLTKFNLKLLVLLIIFININISFSLEKSKENTKYNASLLASKWLQLNREKDLTSISDKDLKSTLYQELIKKMHAKIDEKTFNEVYKIIRRKKIKLALGKQLGKMFKLKIGK